MLGKIASRAADNSHRMDTPLVRAQEHRLLDALGVETPGIGIEPQLRKQIIGNALDLPYLRRSAATRQAVDLQGPKFFAQLPAEKTFEAPDQKAD